LLSLFKAPFIRIMHARTIRRSAKGSIATARKWRRRRFTVTILEILSYLGAIVLGVVLVWSLVVMLLGPGILTRLNDRCGRYSAACGAEVGFLIPLLSVALASAVFLFYRLRHVTRPVVRKAKSSPQHLVETATPDIGEIVGRDELCQVIMEDIHHPDTRRPHLLVGGVGTGKTAVLVQLTGLFAERRAVPVPIRLRDAKGRLNFREMAHSRFLAMAEGSMLSADDAEKVWRQLSKDDKIVVIADGLEEALTDGSAHQDRDNVIRLAIHRAHELGMPLIIASRPHEPLRGADATIMELEPLSEEAALKYITGGDDRVDARWLDWIVETARLTELPLYLQITRQLWQRGQLDYLSADWSTKKVDVRNLDRSRLRRHLLDMWMQALFDGHLAEAVPLSRREREAAVKWLSALACIGLKEDTVDIKFVDYYKGKQAGELDVNLKPRYAEIDQAIQLFVKDKLYGRNLDIRLAVAWGDRLQLVEAYGDGLRFRHSIMQAYLGSCFIRTALEDSRFREDVKTSLRSPGRELLIALVLYSRSAAADVTEPPKPELEAASAESPPAIMAGQTVAGTAGASRMGPEASERGTAGASTPEEIAGDGQASTGLADPPSAAARATAGPRLYSNVGSIRDVLEHSAREALDDVKKLDLYAAALEIDSFLEESRHQEIAESVARSWDGIRGGDQRTLDEAKLGLVRRFGDGVRTITGRPGRGMVALDPAYKELLEIGHCELSYPIRLAIAQEIGAGGDDAFRILHEPFDNPTASVWTNTAWPDEIRKAEKGREPSKCERDEGDGKSRQDDESGSEDKNRILQGRTLCAWLAPLLVGSVDQYRQEARQELRRWLERVGHDDPGSGDYFHLSLEVALAQGFKYAANRRLRHPHALPETRFYLAEQAMEMLKRAHFWFSQLTLIHALCLWEMLDPGVPGDSKADIRSNSESSARDRAHRPGSNPEAIVGRWLGVARNKDHPFVGEAGKLAVRALETGHPEQFLWIDESGIVSSVGSRATQAMNYRKHHLWIPPSSGWAALDPHAQQLVADVLIVLNLAERGEEPGEIEQRLRRVHRSDLPPCISRSRDPLNPRRTVGGVYTAPGTNCMDGCPFRLCPYPPNGVQPYRSELSEAFCRRQQTLLSRGMTAPWQTSRRADLKRFWAQMANRARGGSTDHDLDQLLSMEVIMSWAILSRKERPRGREWPSSHPEWTGRTLGNRQSSLTSNREGMHAGDPETSILLHANPEPVRDGCHTADWVAGNRLPRPNAVSVQLYRPR
jgi:hypothetical protein